MQKPAFLNAAAEFAPEVEPAAREMIRQEWELLSRVTEFLLRILPRSMRVQYDRELLELRDDLAEAGEEDAPQIIALMDGLASLAEHPLPQYMALGLRVTVNTDNRLISATNSSR